MIVLVVDCHQFRSVCCGQCPLVCNNTCKQCSGATKTVITQILLCIYTEMNRNRSLREYAVYVLAKTDSRKMKKQKVLVIL